MKRCSLRVTWVARLYQGITASHQPRNAAARVLASALVLVRASLCSAWHGAGSSAPAQIKPEVYQPEFDKARKVGYRREWR